MMFQASYEKMVQFASEGDLAAELSRAREEFVQRTGDLFESDAAYERRLASFLEWYVLDRPVSFAPHTTPAKMYIEAVRDTMTTPQLTELRLLTRTQLSVFEFLGAKPEQVKLKDLLTAQKLTVFERRKPAGLEPGDIIEARLVPWSDTHVLSETVGVHPRAARKTIVKVTKRFRKRDPNGDRVGLVHRLAYFANRCERYAHRDPREIYAALEDE